jgi:hypothetical protein
MDNPEYHPPASSFWLPSLADRVQMKLPEEAKVVKSEDPKIPDTVEKKYEPTVSGRQGRGQLEYRVKTACDSWIKDGEQGHCDTKWIAEYIQKQFKIDVSRGAIHAVWVRWAEIGFCSMEAKPNRFTGYTKKGVELGLEALKLTAKDSANKVKIQQKLGKR